MKKQYYFFMFIFLFLTQFVNAQGDPNLFSKVYSLYRGQRPLNSTDANSYVDYLVGIENVDNDPEKEIVLVSYWEVSVDLSVYDGMTGNIEWQKSFYDIMTPYSTIVELSKRIYNNDNSNLYPKLIDMNKDGKFEILVAVRIRDYYDIPEWQLYSLGGSMKPLVK